MRLQNVKNSAPLLWRYIALAAIIFFHGCAATKLAPLEELKAFPTIPADGVHIYFMRPASTVGGAVWPAILVDGKKRGILPSAAFTIITMQPGEHTISLEDEQGSIGDWPSAVLVRVQAGQRYFMKLEVISDITKGITIAPAFIPSVPFMILPTQERRIRSMRWIALPEQEGIKETGFLMYSPVEKSGY